jgi:hypothetical protein
MTFSMLFPTDSRALFTFFLPIHAHVIIILPCPNAAVFGSSHRSPRVLFNGGLKGTIAIAVC